MQAIEQPRLALSRQRSSALATCLPAAIFTCWRTHSGREIPHSAARIAAHCARGCRTQALARCSQQTRKSPRVRSSVQKS